VIAPRDEFLVLAFEVAVQGVEAGAGGPFGAVVVRGDEVVSRAHNQVVSTNDPTAHAEIGAIRAACAALNSFQLDDCDLYASCEPCPMCLGAIYWARPRAVFFSSTREDAAAAGFDDAFVYDELGLPPSERTLPMTRVEHPGSTAPFVAWAAKPDRIEY
jgi:tRNA(Arg) A34 adenosine deaminase TadA